MKYRIILEDKQEKELRRCDIDFSSLDFESLCLKKLNELSPYDYDVFSPDDMLEIIDDLNRISRFLKAQSIKSEIGSILEMAEFCKVTPSTTLVFTPDWFETT